MLKGFGHSMSPLLSNKWAAFIPKAAPLRLLAWNCNSSFLIKSYECTQHHKLTLSALSHRSTRGQQRRGKNNLLNGKTRCASLLHPLHVPHSFSHPQLGLDQKQSTSLVPFQETDTSSVPDPCRGGEINTARQCQTVGWFCNMGPVPWGWSNKQSCASFWSIYRWAEPYPAAPTRLPHPSHPPAANA